jgi:hypothetical protein
MAAAVEQLKRSVGYFVEMAPVLAQVRRAHFNAYIAEGFTPAEAIELCKKATL